MFKQVLKTSEARAQVFDYRPKALEHRVPDEAMPFMRSQDEEPPENFEINRLVADSTGLSELEKRNHQTRIENEVLAKLKEVEERAYAQAHELGLKEGREKAFEETKTAVDEAVSRLAQIIETVVSLKADLVTANEKTLIETVFHFAKALAFKEVSADPAVIKSVLKEALESAQHEEEIVIYLNPRDVEFIKSIQAKPGSPLERLSKFRLEPAENVSPGGCLVETNYGVIDATTEQRVSKIYQSIAEKIPQVKAE